MGAFVLNAVLAVVPSSWASCRGPEGTAEIEALCESNRALERLGSGVREPGLSRTGQKVRLQAMQRELEAMIPHLEAMERSLEAETKSR